MSPPNPTAKQPLCAVAAPDEWSDFVFRLDRVWGNGDGRLQAAEAENFVSAYQGSPQMQALPHWQWLARRVGLWGNGNDRVETADATALVHNCRGQGQVQNESKVPVNAPFSYNPKIRRLSLDKVDLAWRRTGSRWPLDRWASLYPNARLPRSDLPLSQLAQKNIGGTRLGEATLDRNGELDLTHLKGRLLEKWTPQFILRKDDDQPVSFHDFAKRSSLRLDLSEIPPAYRKALRRLALPQGKEKKGNIFLDLSQEKNLNKILAHPQLQGLWEAFRDFSHALPISSEEQKRAWIVAGLDFPGSELWVDDTNILSDHPKDRGVPTVHGSVKVNPEYPDTFVLIYTPLYLRSRKPQGNQGKWDGSSPKRGYVHQGDSESVYVLLDSQEKVREVLGDTHYYLTRTPSTQVGSLRKGAPLVLSVSYQAHGNRLAQEETRQIEARSGSLRACSGGSLYDVFPGFQEVREGQALQVTPRLEMDTQGLTDLHTQFGKTIGYRNWGFNDGIRFRRIRTDRWQYNTTPIFDFIDREEKGFTDHCLGLSVNYKYRAMSNAHRMDLMLMLPRPKFDGIMFLGGVGGYLEYGPDPKRLSGALRVEGMLGYGYKHYLPYASLGINLPYTRSLETEKNSLSLGLDIFVYPLSFHYNRIHLAAGAGTLFQVPKVLSSGSFQLGSDRWWDVMLGVQFTTEF